MTTIHVDDNPPWEAMAFEEVNNEPILEFNEIEGWVLNYLEPDGNGVEDYVTGIRDRDDVDEALARAAKWLADYDPGTAGNRHTRLRLLK